MEERSEGMKVLELRECEGGAISGGACEQGV